MAKPATPKDAPPSATIKKRKSAHDVADPVAPKTHGASPPATKAARLSDQEVADIKAALLRDARRLNMQRAEAIAEHEAADIKSVLLLHARRLNQEQAQAATEAQADLHAGKTSEAVNATMTTASARVRVSQLKQEASKEASSSRTQKSQPRAIDDEVRDTEAEVEAEQDGTIANKDRLSDPAAKSNEHISSPDIKSPTVGHARVTAVLIPARKRDTSNMHPHALKSTPQSLAGVEEDPLSSAGDHANTNSALQLVAFQLPRNNDAKSANQPSNGIAQVAKSKSLAQSSAKSTEDRNTTDCSRDKESLDNSASEADAGPADDAKPTKQKTPAPASWNRLPEACRDLILHHFLARQARSPSQRKHSCRRIALLDARSKADMLRAVDRRIDAVDAVIQRLSAAPPRADRKHTAPWDERRDDEGSCIGAGPPQGWERERKELWGLRSYLATFT